MSLDVDIDHEREHFRLQAKFTSQPGLVSLFGRSGSGKTTLVNIVAGLIRPTRGRVAVDGQVLVDTERGIFVAKHRRRIGYVFQEGRLFPHMTVAKNLEYGRWMGGLTPDPAETERIVALLDIGSLLRRRPGRLSGGERQRVAIGRALLMKPRLLLLDEPLASLDRARKLEILPYLARLRDEAKVPMVYVSHQAGEIQRIASQVVRIEDGQVLASGGLELLDAERREVLS